MLSLFDENTIKELYTKEELLKKQRKRGCYKTKPRKRAPNVNLYAQMAYYYQALGSYFDIKSDVDITFDLGYFRIWFTIYTNEIYEYQGLKFEGICDKIKEAEVAGTENWNIEKRVQYYKRLFDIISNNETPMEAVEKLNG